MRRRSAVPATEPQVEPRGGLPPLTSTVSALAVSLRCDERPFEEQRRIRVRGHLRNAGSENDHDTGQAIPSGKSGSDNFPLTSQPLGGSTILAINGLEYIASYPDLIAAFGANAAAGVQHYETNGAAGGPRR